MQFSLNQLLNYKIAIPVAIITVIILGGGGFYLYQNQRNQVQESPQVIDVAPINIGTQSAQQEVVKESLAKVVLRNGTKTSGLTTKIEKKLKDDGVKFETLVKENAQKQNYEKSVVVLVDESSRDLAKSISNVLGAQISDLPEGEKKADDADIIVILGKDAT